MTITNESSGTKIPSEQVEAVSALKPEPILKDEDVLPMDHYIFPGGAPTAGAEEANKIREGEVLEELRKDLGLEKDKPEEIAESADDPSKVSEIKDLFKASLDQIAEEKKSDDPELNKKRDLDKNYLIQSINWLSWFDELLQKDSDQENIVISTRDKVAFDDVVSVIKSFYDRAEKDWVDEKISDAERVDVELYASKYQDILSWAKNLNNKIEVVQPVESAEPVVEAQKETVAETPATEAKLAKKSAVKKHSVLAKRTAEKMAGKIGHWTFEPSAAAVQAQLDTISKKENEKVAKEQAIKEKAEQENLARELFLKEQLAKKESLVEQNISSLPKAPKKESVLAKQTAEKYAKKRGWWSFKPSREAMQKQSDQIAGKENVAKVQKEKAEQVEKKNRGGFLSRYFSFNKKNASKFSGREQLARAEKTAASTEGFDEYKGQSNEDVEDSVTQVILDTINGDSIGKTENTLDSLFNRNSIGSKKGAEMYKYIVDNLEGVLESKQMIPARNRNLVKEEFIKNYIEKKKIDFKLN